MQTDRILIVDDEPDIALILKLQLEDAGYQTVTARDGVEALNAIEHGRFSLILLDIKMPRMDGLEVLSRIKVEESPVVMMTAHGSEDIAVNAMRKGALDYISKPFSTDDLLQKVERAIAQHKTKRALEEEQLKMAAVLQGMADLLVAIDLEGRIIMVSRMTETMLGRPKEELLGRKIEEVLKASVEELPSRVVLRTGEAYLGIAYTMSTQNQEIPVLSSAAPLKDSAGKLVGSVEIVRDVSKLRELEQEKEDFVSMLSHDLKSPITAVVGSIDLVREARLGAVNEEQCEYLNAAVESCEEMVEMIDTLLGIHKFEAGKMRLNFREEEPEALVKRSLGKFLTQAGRAGIRLYSTAAGEIPRISVDRSLFARVLGNLLSNAIKFTPEEGEIELSIDPVEEVALLAAQIPVLSYGAGELPPPGRYVRIRVRDTGIGIPADALGTIFDRFVQAKNRRLGKTRGTGLGLAFCRKAMDAHHGWVWAESEAGKGSLFTLLFPALEPEDDD